MNPVQRASFYTRYHLLTGLYFLGMTRRVGPIKLLKDMRQYAWLRAIARANKLYGKFGKNRDDIYLTATFETILYVIKAVARVIEEGMNNPDRTIIHEDMIPREIFRAMGIYPFMAEMLGIALPIIEPHAMEEYIDVCENSSVPPDICSLPKSTMGMALADQLPPGIAMVTSNLPCDGGMSSYTVLEQHLKLPTLRIDIPHHFYNERALSYFTGELRRLIKWMEQHTPGKMDWNKLKEICEERNRMVEYELELWEMIRVRPAPLAGETVYLSHLVGANVLPGEKESTEIFKKLCEFAKQNLAAGTAAIKQEKYRALLWNPPLLHASDLFIWAEKAYGVSLIMDSMSYNHRDPFIDTTSEEAMLRGIGMNIMEGPMARHTRGPAENYIEDIFRMVKQFDIDMVWVAGHVGCKNTAALNGMLRERCRENGLPMLIINYDLSDPRVVSKEAILEQVNHFMENIMSAKRLDI